jgi:hypothetical protein
VPFCKCGFLASEEETKCPKCGAAIGEVVEVVESRLPPRSSRPTVEVLTATVINKPGEEIRCHKCGTRYGLDDIRCPKCDNILLREWEAICPVCHEGRGTNTPYDLVCPHCSGRLFVLVDVGYRTIGEITDRSEYVPHFSFVCINGHGPFGQLFCKNRDKTILEGKDVRAKILLLPLAAYLVWPATLVFVVAVLFGLIAIAGVLPPIPILQGVMGVIVFIWFTYFWAKHGAFNDLCYENVNRFFQPEYKWIDANANVSRLRLWR